MRRCFAGILFAFLSTAFAHASAPAQKMDLAACESFAADENALDQATVAWFSKCPSARWTELFHEAFKDGAKTFYENSADLNRRYRLGEEHPRLLHRLGYKYDSASSRLVYPENPLTIAVRFNLEIQRRIDEGTLAEGDAIFATLLFTEAKDVSKNVIRETPLSSHRFVRPGIDEWPSPDEGLSPVLILPQFTHTQFEEMLAGGHMPISMGGDLMDHDFAHLTELYSQGTMVELRRFFRLNVNRSPEWREEMNKYRMSWTNAPARVSAYRSRLIVINEAFATVNLELKEKVREMLPEFFSENGPKNWAQQRYLFRYLSLDQIKARVEDRLKTVPTLLLRQGGSHRDPYNFPRQLAEGSLVRVIKSYLEKGKWPYPIRHSTTTGSEPGHRESLLGMTAELDFLYRRLWPQKGTPKDPDFLYYAIKEQLARLETGLAYGVILEMTHADLIRDSAGETVSPDSKSARFFKKWVREGSFLWEAYLSPAAQGRQ